MADLIIRGMEMPEYCYECPCHNGESGYCQAYKSGYLYGIERPAKCPLVSLPEGHGRLIDADALDEAFTALRFADDWKIVHWGDRKNWCLHGSEIEKLIDNAPTIVPAEGGTEECSEN